MHVKGAALLLHKVWITDRLFGPVYLALAHAQTRNGYEEWAILSDAPTDLHTFDEYGLRLALEENFLDDKSAGFQLESVEIRDADALARLALSWQPPRSIWSVPAPLSLGRAFVLAWTHTGNQA